MASSGHSNKQRTDMQTAYTAAGTTASNAPAGQNTVIAWAKTEQALLQQCVTREQGAPLS